MTLIINGVDMMPLLMADGITWRRVDYDGKAAGKAINGHPIRDRVAEGYVWSLKYLPLTSTQLATVLSAVRPPYLTVVYSDPETATEAIDDKAVVYSADLPLKRELLNGVEVFSGLTFQVECVKSG